jgi:hypothetical protein
MPRASAWDPVKVAERAQERSVTLNKKRKLLTSQEVALAEARAQEFAGIAKRYNKITFELNMTLSKHILQAKSEQVAEMGTDKLPINPVERLQLMRHLLNTMQTDTIEE